MMREQLGVAVGPDRRADIRRCLSVSNASLASTCSTATEIPERKEEISLYPTMGSPSSEGYKSACGSSDLGLADTESFSVGSRASSTTDLYQDHRSGVSCSTDSSTGGLDNVTSQGEADGGSHHPPSLQDFTDSLYMDHNWTSSSNSLLSESMFASTYALKYEAFECKVRKLCQSTADLDEKMRLARLECGY